MRNLLLCSSAQNLFINYVNLHENMFTNARDIIINGKKVNIQDKPRSVSAGAGSKVSNKSGKDNGSSEVEDEM